MAECHGLSSPIRFGPFELDVRTAELRRDGRKIKLEGQPFRVLVFLVEHAGELVARDQLKSALWPADTFVDFEHGINTAVKRVREALGDSAETPRFIQTLPRRGYRFVYPVTQSKPASPAVPIRRRTAMLVASGIAVLALAVGVYLLRQPFGSDRPHIGSLAVLPCTNLSGDPNQEYIADGMMDALTASLSKIHALTVKSRTSAMTSKGTRLTVREVAQRLGVDAIVECSVRRSDQQIDITVQLIDAERDAHVWADTYRRDVQSMITVQDDAARDIARAIAAAIAPEETRALGTQSTRNPGAYQSYLKGRHHFLNGRMQKAVESFSQAISLDGGYAEAYAGLGASESLQPLEGLLSPTEALTRATAAASRALQLNPRVGEAHAVLGWTKLNRDWDWVGAEREFEQALDFNPSDEIAHMWYGCELIWRGDFERGLAELTRARDLAPAEPSLAAFLGMGLYLARHYDAAVLQLHDAIELGPELPVSHSLLGLTLSARGMQLEAITELEKAVELARSRHPENLAMLSRLGYGYAVAGQKLKAQAVLEELKRRAAERYVPPVYFAMISAGLGDNAEALGWLDRGFESGDRAFELLAIKVEPRLDSLRSNPRFAESLQRLGLR